MVFCLLFDNNVCCRHPNTSTQDCVFVDLTFQLCFFVFSFTCFPPNHLFFSRIFMPRFHSVPVLLLLHLPLLLLCTPTTSLALHANGTLLFGHVLDALVQQFPASDTYVAQLCLDADLLLSSEGLPRATAQSVTQDELLAKTELVMARMARLHPDVPASANAVRAELGHYVAQNVRPPLAAHHVLLAATAAQHLQWLQQHHQQQHQHQQHQPPQHPVYVMPSVGCDMGLYQQLQLVTTDVAAGAVLLQGFYPPHTSSADPRPHKPLTTEASFHFSHPDNASDGYVFTGSQEPSWAYVASALPPSVRHEVRYPVLAMPTAETPVGADWALLTFAGPGHALPALPASVLARTYQSALDPPLTSSSPPAPTGQLPGAVHWTLRHLYAPGAAYRPVRPPLPAAAMLPFTPEAQQDIWERQNPRDCASAKFAVLRMYYAGIGSHVHKVTAAMAVAHQLGRVLLLDPTAGKEYASAAFCGPPPVGLHCFFLPLSVCGMPPEWPAGAVPMNCSVDQSHARVLNMSTFDTDAVPAVPPDGVPPTTCRGGLHLKWVPSWWASRLPPSHIAPHYWWRAQASTYVMRLTPKTSAFLSAARDAALPGPPLGPGVVHFHVRHGDKFIEMPLEPLERYVAAAERHLGGGSRAGFLSTEDPEVVDDARYNHREWHMRYVSVRRDNLPPMERANLLGGATEMLLSLLQLFVALECDAWVCTRESNWCRLIDELRSTVAGKAGASERYVEVGDTTPTAHTGLTSWYW